MMICQSLDLCMEFEAQASRLLQIPDVQILDWFTRGIWTTRPSHPTWIWKEDPSPSDGEKATTARSATSAASAVWGFRTHDQGHCRPCVFHSSPGGCRRGSSCNYCHFFHPRVVLVHSIRKSMRNKIKCSWETHWYFLHNIFLFLSFSFVAP